MASLLLQVIIVCAIAIAAWWLVERFSPDGLLTKLCKLAIFVGVIAWFIVKIMPRVV